MAKKQIKKEDPIGLGNIAVSKEVVATIAALETIKVRGVVGISGGYKADSIKALPKSELVKGVEVWMKPGEAVATISIYTNYEVGIFKVAEEVQSSVKSAIEMMTGLKVPKINVNIHGVKFKEETKKTKENIQKNVKK